MFSIFAKTTLKVTAGYGLFKPQISIDYTDNTRHSIWTWSQANDLTQRILRGHCHLTASNLASGNHSLTIFYSGFCRTLGFNCYIPVVFINSSSVKASVGLGDHGASFLRMPLFLYRFGQLQRFSSTVWNLLPFVMLLWYALDQVGSKLIPSLHHNSWKPFFTPLFFANDRHCWSSDHTYPEPPSEQKSFDHGQYPTSVWTLLN
jgi:hypothetical protein